MSGQTRMASTSCVTVRLSAFFYSGGSRVPGAPSRILIPPAATGAWEGRRGTVGGFAREAICEKREKMTTREIGERLRAHKRRAFNKCNKVMTVVNHLVLRACGGGIWCWP